MRRGAIGLAGLLLLVLGCSTERDPRDLLAPGEVGTIVVDGRLIVGSRIPQIYLRTTQSPTEPYDAARAALWGATVEVVASTGDTIRYLDGGSGRYYPIVQSGSYGGIRPATTYRLRVVAPDGRVVTATTTTPDTFHVRDWVLLDDPSLAVSRRLVTFADYPLDPDSVYLAPSNQLVYQDGLLEARFDRGNALAFQVGLSSLDDGSPYVIDAKFLSESDLAKLERITSSPPFEGTGGSIRMPWLAIFFAGRYNVRIYSVDRNWYDLARSTDFLGAGNIGFGTNAGDNFERPIFHVEGGIGFFGSAAMDEIGFTILPKP